MKLCEHTTHCWLHTLLVMVCHQWLIICNMQLNKQLILKREHAVKCHSVMAADLNIWLLADHHGRLYRCWWRMLVTVSVGDILEIFLADLRCCWPIFALKSHAKNCHHHKVTKIKLSPTWLWLNGRKRQKYKSVINVSILSFLCQQNKFRHQHRQTTGLKIFVNERFVVGSDEFPGEIPWLWNTEMKVNRLGGKIKRFQPQTFSLEPIPQC